MAILPRVVTEASASGAQVIDGSLDLDGAQEQYLSRDPSTAGNQRTWTYAAWFERSDFSNEVILFGADEDNTNVHNWCVVRIEATPQMTFINNNSNSTGVTLKTSRYFRDTGWYHVVLAVDTTQTTETNRVKLYINGEQVKDFATSSYPALNYQTQINSTNYHWVGREARGYYYRGKMSQVYLIDGQQLEPAEFGYTDPLTNTWRPKKYTGDFTFTYTIPQSGGGLPLLDTDDNLGKVASSPEALRTDSNSGNLSLALVCNTTGNLTDDKSTNSSDPTNNGVTASTTKSHFYGTSARFDGADWMATPSSATFDMSTGDFTVEAWINLDNFDIDAGANPTIFGNSGGSYQQQVYVTGAGKVIAGNSGSSYMESSTTLVAGTWYHIAVTRASSTGRLFINGTLEDTESSWSTDLNGTTYYIGAFDNGTNGKIHGYLQDIRIYKGVATYTASFIPAGSPGGINSFYLPLDGNSPAGEDKSGNGNDWTLKKFGGSTVIPKATGALPTFNTVSGGKVAVPGVRGQVGVAVTVYNSGSGNKYYLDGEEAKSLSQYRGQNVWFDTSDSTCANHPLKFSTTADGTHGGGSEYTDGVSAGISTGTGKASTFGCTFNGVDSYLISNTSSDDTDISEGDCTIEFWVRSEDIQTAYNPGSYGSLVNICTDNSAIIWGFGVTDSDHYIQFYYWTGSASVSITGNTSLQNGVWYHIAMVRNSTKMYLYVNGTEQANYTYGSVSSANHPLTIGVDRRESTDKYFAGEISNLRMVKGTAVYTGNFTPPTSPLTAITNTTVLLCQSSDPITGTAPGTMGNNNNVISVTNHIFEGGTRITFPHNVADTLYYYCGNHSGMGGSLKLSTDIQKADPYAWKCLLAIPFAGDATDYSNEVNCNSITKAVEVVNANVQYDSSNFYGQSFHFDGTSDYITVETRLPGAWGAENNSFCLEGWVKPDMPSGDGQIFYMSSAWGAGDYFYMQRTYDSSGAYKGRGGGGYITAGSNPANGVDSWDHVAYTCDGTTVRLFVNGVLVGSQNKTSYTWLDSFVVRIGGDTANTPDSLFIGHMQDLRIYFGTAKYTENFIPASTIPDILPDTPSGAAYSSDLIKATAGSVGFDGTGDYLSLASSSDTTLGGVDFTMECWVYFTGTGTDVFFENDTGTGGCSIQINGSNLLSVQVGATNITSTNALSTNRWHHLCVQRDHSASTTYAYVDGVQVNTTGTDSGSSTSAVTIGGRSGGSFLTTGNISNARIVKGSVVYAVGGFTPPTSPLTNITNTKLLCCQGSSAYNFSPVKTGTAVFNLPLSSTPFADSSSNTYTVTNTGSVATASAGTNRFNITNAASFDGSSQRLNMNSNVTLTGDWTIDAWIKLDSSASGYNAIYNSGYTSSNNTYIYMSLDDDEKPYLEGGSAGGRTTATNAINKNQWYHFRAIQAAGSMHLYVDGEKVVTHGQNTTDMSSLGTDCIGSLVSNGNNANNFHGLIGPVRYVSSTLGAPPVGGLPTTAGALSNTPVIAMGVAANAKASPSNPFDDDIDIVMGKPTGYCTWNALDVKGGNTWDLVDAALYMKGLSGGASTVHSTMAVNTGKWYFEGTVQSKDNPAENSSNGYNNIIGITLSDDPTVGTTTPDSRSIGAWFADQGWYRSWGSTWTNTGGGWAIGDVIAVSFDCDKGDITFYKNNIIVVSFTSQWTAGKWITPALIFWEWEYGGLLMNFGQKPFKFSPPEGFNAICNTNLPSPGLTRPDQYVGVTTYTGNGSTQSLTGLGFQPDLVLIKVRSAAYNDVVYDSVRGPFQTLETPSQNAQNDRDPYGVTSFDRDGFTVKGLTNGDYQVNGTPGGTYSGSTGGYVGWCWKAGGSKGTWNKDGKAYASAAAAGLDGGSIDPSGASVGTEQGFGIYKYTGNGTSGADIAHGLTQAPDLIIAKNLGENSTQWLTSHRSAGLTGDNISGTSVPEWYELYLNGTAAAANNSTDVAAPDGATKITLGSGDNINKNTISYIMYAWHNIPGVQKFGSYEGNADDDGPFIYTGHRPRIIWMKGIDSTKDWVVVDSGRDPYNVANKKLYLNSNTTESSSANGQIDILSNGFKLRKSHAMNNAAETFIYASWADQPLHNLYGGQSNAR